MGYKWNMGFVSHIPWREGGKMADLDGFGLGEFGIGVFILPLAHGTRIIEIGLLGKKPEDKKPEGLIQLSWLKDNFERVADAGRDNDEAVTKYCRAFLLYIIGSSMKLASVVLTLVSNKSWIDESGRTKSNNIIKDFSGEAFNMILNDSIIGLELTNSLIFCLEIKNS